MLCLHFAFELRLRSRPGPGFIAAHAFSSGELLCSPSELLTSLPRAVSHFQYPTEKNQHNKVTCSHHLNKERRFLHSFTNINSDDLQA